MLWIFPFSLGNCKWTHCGAGKPRFWPLEKKHFLQLQHPFNKVIGVWKLWYSDSKTWFNAVHNILFISIIVTTHISRARLSKGWGNLLRKLKRISSHWPILLTVLASSNMTEKWSYLSSFSTKKCRSDDPMSHLLKRILGKHPQRTSGRVFS